MKTKFLKYLAAAALAFSGALTSCDLDCINPVTPPVDFLTSQDRFVLNMVGIQQEWRNDMDVNVMRNAGELRSGIYGVTGIDGSVLNDLTIVQNQLDAAHSQFSGFGGYYGLIANLNNFIIEAEAKESLFTPDAYNYLRAMAHGMRAYCYFQIYKMYGTAPLRTGNEVFNGEYNAVKLFSPRASCADMMKLIKDDVNASIALFDAGKNFVDARITGTKANFWNNMASEMLAGEVYLWNAKVDMYTDANGNIVEGLGLAKTPGDIATAKAHFEKVIAAGYALQPNYADVFATNKKNNAEIILQTYYGYGVATANWYWYSFWNYNTGTGKGTWWTQLAKDGLTPIAGANRLGTYIGEDGKVAYNEMYYRQGGVVNRYMYKNAVYYQFDSEDARRDAQLQACYIPRFDENGLDQSGNPVEGSEKVWYLDSFNPEDYHMAGALTYKYRGELQNNTYVGTNNMIYYRLPLAYMYLAEIANYEGVGGDVEKYINLVRARAYGDKFTGHEFTYTNFKDAEVAILNEKTKEFLQEGQRWWDLRRLTTVKDGAPKDHLLFQPEGCPGYGLDVEAHPNWNEIATTLALAETEKVETNVPVLDYAKKWHMALWPIPAGEIVNDTVDNLYMVQTVGY